LLCLPDYFYPITTCGYLQQESWQSLAGHAQDRNGILQEEFDGKKKVCYDERR